MNQAEMKAGNKLEEGQGGRQEKEGRREEAVNEASKKAGQKKEQKQKKNER